MDTPVWTILSAFSGQRSSRYAQSIARPNLTWMARACVCITACLPSKALQTAQRKVTPSQQSCLWKNL